MEKRDKQWLEWIRQQQCVECCKHGPSEPHHCKGDLNLSGMGMKAPDYLSMPLCMECHQLIHAAGTDWKAIQREGLIRTLLRAFDDGMIVRAGEQ